MKPASGSGGRHAAMLGGVLVAAGVLYLLASWPSAYPWMKALHLIAVIAWMAGLLYLPRLFVYHAEAGPGSPQSETFKIMERRLLRAIMTPAMLAAWLIGLWLIAMGPGLSAGWLHAKLAAVLVLSAFHMHLAASVRRFASDENRKTTRYWRFMNEVPTLLMIAIVVLAVVKPF